MILAQNHFGPEPKILDFNLSSSRQKASFHPFKSYTANINAFYFRIPFNCWKCLQDITTARSNMTDYTQLFNTLTASDLPNSLHLRNTFFCKGRRELRTDIENSCLTALYFGMPDKTRTQMSVPDHHN